jgi:alkylhydroperoxidase/carboxymuconolactone decarboxylase family protein YurZ
MELAGRLFRADARGQSGMLPKALRDYTLEHVFGDLWQQDDLTLQERELATSAMLIALNLRALAQE